MSKDILVYTKHEEIFEKVKDCVEKVKREKALVGQNFYVENGKGLLFDVEINWIWSTGNLTLKVVCDTFEGYGDKESCCVILKDLTDKQIAGIFTDLIFKRMASIRKDIEKDRKETEKKEAENDIHKLKVEINRVITDLIADVGGDTGLYPPHKYYDMSAFTSCRSCVTSRSFKWNGHKFSISIDTKDHSMNCLLINGIGHNKLIFEFKDPFTPYSNLSNICSIADAIAKTIKEEEKETEENTDVNKAWAECVLLKTSLNDAEKVIKKRTEELHATEADYSSLAADYDKLLDEKKDLEEKVKDLQACNNRQYNTITNLQKNLDAAKRDKYYGYLFKICDGYYKWDKGMNEGNGLEATFEFKNLIHGILIDFEGH